jgi:uncharacterized protein YbbC (DUF1343 family)
MKYYFLSLVCLLVYCGSGKKNIVENTKSKDYNQILIEDVKSVRFETGADNFTAYLPMLKGKKVGVVTNQSGIISRHSLKAASVPANTTISKTTHLVDFLIEQNINVQKIFAPEHGFRGTADAGELIEDGKDTKTGLPIISLYGDNKKPKNEQLKGIEVMVFDLQDVGARFYTYVY